MPWAKPVGPVVSGFSLLLSSHPWLSRKRFVHFFKEGHWVLLGHCLHVAAGLCLRGYSARVKTAFSPNPLKLFSWVLGGQWCHQSSDRFQVLPLAWFPGLESPTMQKNNVRIWENDLESTLLCRPCLCAVFVQVWEFMRAMMAAGALAKNVCETWPQTVAVCCTYSNCRPGNHVLCLLLCARNESWFPSYYLKY